MPARCQPRCSLELTESKLLLAKNSKFCIEIFVAARYEHITIENEEKLATEQLAALIAADPASDHTDFPLRNFFFDG